MFSCEYCGNTFSASSNLSRHKKNVCLPKQEHEKVFMEKILNEFKLKENTYINEIDTLKTKHTELEKENLKLSVENEFLKKTTNDLEPIKNKYMNVLEKSHETNNKIMEINSETAKINAETSSKSLGTVRYISKHLTKAPPLKYKAEEIAGLLEHTSSKRYRAVDYVFYNYKEKQLPKWIGDIILQIYQKENPFDQSAWSTDASRYSYIICEVMKGVNGKQNEWITDKSGIKMTNIIIKPTLKLLTKMLNEYLNETVECKVSDLSMDQMMKITINRNMATSIIKEINDKTLHKEILKYITPHLTADITKLEDIINRSLYGDSESDNNEDDDKNDIDVLDKHSNKKSSKHKNIEYSSDDMSIDSKKQSKKQKKN